MKTQTKMSYWQDEDCENCGASLVEKTVELFRKKGKGYYLLRDVPAGVCPDCGSRYFSANVLKLIQKVPTSKSKTTKAIEVPVYSLHAS